MELLQNSPGQVIHHKTRHVDRVLGGGVGRCVGKVQVLQLNSRHSGVDSGGQHVNPLINALVAYNLGSQKAEGSLFKTTFMVISLPPG